MRAANIPTVYIIGGGAVLAALLYFQSKGDKGEDGYGGGFFQDVGAGIGSSAVHAVNNVLSGVAIGAGDALGVPRVNKTACELAKEQGRTLDASFACPALDFLSYVNPFK
jgi:hypothetical protein